MSKRELLSCPFCGGAATFVKHSAGVPKTQAFDSWDAVACKSCGATVGACDRRFRSRDDARGIWNRRASLPAAQEVQPLTADHVWTTIDRLAGPGREFGRTDVVPLDALRELLDPKALAALIQQKEVAPNA